MTPALYVPGIATRSGRGRWHLLEVSTLDGLDVGPTVCGARLPGWALPDFPAMRLDAVDWVDLAWACGRCRSWAAVKLETVDVT